MNARKITLLVVSLLAVLLSSSSAKRFSDKRVQGSSSFKTMVRYGRMTPVANEVEGKREPKVNIRTGPDSFFLGPRYGKRSAWTPSSPSFVYPLDSSPLCGFDEDLSCTYTGIADLYRCTTRKGQTMDDSTSSTLK